MTEVKNALFDCFLFNGIGKREIKKCLDEAVISTESFKRGDIIYSPESFTKRLGIILSGECFVNRINIDKTRVPIKKIVRLDPFGITAVFSKEDEFPTEIVATGECVVAFIEEDSLLKMIGYSPRIALNVITLLTDRIAFLNKRVAELSSGDCENKLSRYLYDQYKKIGDCEISFNCKKTAELLNIGRASLYRSIKKLEDTGVIKYENGKIIIKDPDGLKGNKK